MKIIYSHLQKLLPNLKVDPKQLSSDLALIGHLVASLEEIEDEYVFDLEIRQNRADCLGYYGLARDLAVYYHLPLQLPQVTPLAATEYQLPITITSADVKRIQALKISQLTISSSPEWLVKFLSLHNINSINNLVDITNYAMLIYGIPCHAFDTAKTSDHLIWENNTRYQDFTTLDGTQLVLKDNLIVSNPEHCLSLSFIGGQNSGIDNSTTEAILEMAIYSPVRIRSDSRSLKTITEASIRLDKFLDTETIPLAFNFLITQVLEICGGQVSSQLFEQYLQKPEVISIPFDPAKPALYAGIDIPTEFATDVLRRLGVVNGVPPSIRKDLTIEEDLIEEVIRFYGYDKIPTNQPISSDKLPDITPKILHLIEQKKDELVAQGYDEVRSWPLVKKPLSPKAISTQNSINSEYPVLRESMVQSLENQLDQYRRFKLPHPQFFEIGKIYSRENGQYVEKYALGTYDGQKFSETILEDLPLPPDYQPSDTNSHAIELTSQIITLDANIEIKDPLSYDLLIRQYSALIDSQILWSMEIIDVYNNRYTFRVSYYNCDDKTAKKIHLSTFGLTDKKYHYLDPKIETNLLYYSDMYQTNAKATIIDIKTQDNLTYIVLDQTIFFPEGGGQPSDIGTINTTNVIKLLYRDGQVLHGIKANSFSIGDSVSLLINWQHRYKYMRVHSAGHLLHEVLMELNPSLVPLKGYHQENAYLTYQGTIKERDISVITSRLHQLVDANLPVLCDYSDIETLKKDARSIPSNLPLHKKLRRLKIGNYPSMTDGGIQVKSTREIGHINITKIETLDNTSTIHYHLPDET